MKKNEQNKTISSSYINSNKNLEIDRIKTTNINILLNRVRLDKKKALKKKLFFLFLLVTSISMLGFFISS